MDISLSLGTKGSCIIVFLLVLSRKTEITCQPTYTTQIILPSKSLNKSNKLKTVIQFGSICIMAQSGWKENKNVLTVSVFLGVWKSLVAKSTHKLESVLRQGIDIRFSNWNCSINCPRRHPHKTQYQVVRKIPHREGLVHCHSIGDKDHGKFVSAGQVISRRIWASVTTFCNGN